ncbi:MAG: S-formylglutathione hydrolase [Burkholderia gladioli]|nr:MAG: S-formylglutathione hydrolase [Burkholderia gladioli]
MGHRPAGRARRFLRIKGSLRRASPALDQEKSTHSKFKRGLNPDLFEAACREAGQPVTLRRHEGYDHGYYFISTFIADHLAHHAKTLLAE